MPSSTPDFWRKEALHRSRGPDTKVLPIRRRLIAEAFGRGGRKVALMFQRGGRPQAIVPLVRQRVALQIEFYKSFHLGRMPLREILCHEIDSPGKREMAKIGGNALHFFAIKASFPRNAILSEALRHASIAWKLKPRRERIPRHFGCHQSVASKAPITSVILFSGFSRHTLPSHEYWKPYKCLAFAGCEPGSFV